MGVVQRNIRAFTRELKRVAFYEKPSVIRSRKTRQSLKRKMQATIMNKTGGL